MLTLLVQEHTWRTTVPEDLMEGLHSQIDVYGGQ